MTRRRLMALFEREADAVAAVAQLRDAGIAVVEVYSPYALHGLEPVPGSGRPTRIAAACLAGGLLGAVAGLALPWWTNAVDWVLDFGGKPSLAWPAWVPIMFEMTVLFAGTATLAAFILDLRVGSARQPTELPRRVSDDGFAIEVELGSEEALRLARGIFEIFAAVEVAEGGDTAGGGGRQA